MQGLYRKSPAIFNMTRTVCTTLCNLAANESGLECKCVNNDDFTVLVSGGGRCHWVYCVAISFKMTEQVKQWICIEFCITLEHSSMETIWMIQEATAMGNWWLAALSQQCAPSCIMSCAKPQINQVTQPPYSPDLAQCNFWLFPKLNHLWRGDILDC